MPKASRMAAVTRAGARNTRASEDGGLGLATRARRGGVYRKGFLSMMVSARLGPTEMRQVSTPESDSMRRT